jgi:hypothetical protein
VTTQQLEHSGGGNVLEVPLALAVLCPQTVQWYRRVRRATTVEYLFKDISGTIYRLMSFIRRMYVVSSRSERYLDRPKHIYCFSWRTEGRIEK